MSTWNSKSCAKVTWSSFCRYEHPRDILDDPTNAWYQVFAYESILMFVPESTWIALGGIVNGDEKASDDLISNVPTLSIVTKLEWAVYSDYTDETKEIVDWLLKRAAYVQQTLPKYKADPAVPQKDPDGRPEDPLEVHRLS